MAQCCSWCKMGFLGRGSTDQHGRVFCTPDHRAEYLIMNPSRCDNCNGVIHTSRLDTKAERFCSTSCAVEYTLWLHDRLPHARGNPPHPHQQPVRSPSDRAESARRVPRRWPPIRTPARNGPLPPRSEPQMNKAAKGSKTIRANKGKAKLKAKHRRQRARATA